MKKLQETYGRLARLLDRIVMFLPFHLVLKPLIERNYRLRYKSAINGDDKYPDEWYWADKIAVKYGYFVNDDPFNVTTKAQIKAMKLQRELFNKRRT